MAVHDARWLRAPCLAALALAGPAAAQAPTPAPRATSVSQVAAALPEYRIAPSDELVLAFPYNAELNRDGPVGPDGRFTVPLIGSVPIGGRTVTEAQAIISDALLREGIVANARPALTVRRYGGTVYVGGEVRTPGAVPLTQQMNPLQAIIVAGGLLDTAKTRAVVLIRRDEQGQPVTYLVNVRSFALKGDPRGATLLQPQDVLFVPKSNIAEVNLFIDQFVNKVLPFSRSVNYNLGRNGGVTTTVGP